MRYPEYIEKNQTIGFIAPSFGCTIEPYRTAFMNAQKKIAAKGYNLWLGPNCFEDCGVGISNTPQKCAEELMKAFAEDDCEAIISCGGGELMCEILPFVDFDRIKACKGKWFMGYSDNTNMTFLLNTLCDTASIYGPCASSFGMEPWHGSIEDAFEVFTGMKKEVAGYERFELIHLKDANHPLAPINDTEKTQYVLYNAGEKADALKLSGRLIGGCIDCLNNLAGTRYDKVAEFNERYGEEGILWFLESCDLSPLDLRRALWHLREAGWFKKASGFLIGRPDRYGEDMMGVTHNSAVISILGELGVPIAMDLDIGHKPPQMPMISGSFASASIKEHEADIRFIFK